MVRQNKGFTLVELLAVIAIIALMALVLVPSISGIQSAGGFNKALSDISLTLTQARLYAMAHNTYVFVGLQETQEQVPPNTTQTITDGRSGGRVWVDVEASADGTAGYNTTSPTTWNQAYQNTTAPDLIPIQKPAFYDNVHLVYLPDDAPNNGSAGGMVRPVVAAADQVGDSSFVLANQAPFPGGLALTIPSGSANPRVTLTKVIQFDPQGVPSILTVGLVPAIEIGLQPTHGQAIPPVPTSSTTGNQAAIQIDGTTGAVTIFRT